MEKHTKGETHTFSGQTDRGSHGSGALLKGANLHLGILETQAGSRFKRNSKQACAELCQAQGKLKLICFATFGLICLV